MKFRIAEKNGRTWRERCFYDRGRKDVSRSYHLFGLCRIVFRDCSFYRLIIGPWVFAFSYRASRGSK